MSMQIPDHTFKNLFRLTLFICMGLLLTACPDERCEDGVDALILDYAGLDGCGWIIMLETGERLEPANLHQFDIEPADSLPVNLTYTEIKDMMSICMVGKIVHISCITTTSGADKNKFRREHQNHNSSSNDYPMKAPAYPGLINYELPDGYILEIYLQGDEHQHTVLTSDGYYLLKNDSGYYEYASRNASGKLISSGIIARNPADRNREAIDYLNSIQQQ